MERLSRMKLDLEAVVEDASNEVYSFQIQKSLIYWKFVGLYIIIYIIILSESLLRKDYSQKSHRTQLISGYQ